MKPVAASPCRGEGICAATQNLMPSLALPRPSLNEGETKLFVRGISICLSLRERIEVRALLSKSGVGFRARRFDCLDRVRNVSDK